MRQDGEHLVRLQPVREQLLDQPLGGSGATGSGASVAVDRRLAPGTAAARSSSGAAAGRVGGGPGDGLGGAHQRQRQPLRLDLDQRNGAQRGEDQVLGVDPQRRLPSAAPHHLGQVALVLAHVVG